MNNTRLLIVLLIGLVLVGCVSSGPKTQYYSLISGSFSAQNKDTMLEVSLPSTGVGPIILPEYLDRTAIVSFTDSNQIRVSGYRAWAGDLKENISRIIASNLSQLWNVDSIVAFPWDNRDRPDRQIRIVFEEFGGILGGKVVLRVRWSIYDTQRAEVIVTDMESLEENTANDSYNAYVAALNKLVNQLSWEIAASVTNVNH